MDIYDEAIMHIERPVCQRRDYFGKFAQWPADLVESINAYPALDSRDYVGDPTCAACPHRPHTADITVSRSFC